MKEEKGITLISLVVTIVIMLIIAGVATYSGIESIEESKKMAFISEMEMIQAKVNSIYEERKNDTSKIEYYNAIGQELSVLNQTTKETILAGISETGFKYFNKNDLEKLDLYNLSQEVIINYDTREVISVNGVKIDGTMYYKLKDIPNYSGYNVEYVNKNTQAPTFTVEQTKLGNYEYRFTLKDIVYNSNVKGGTVSYKQHNDTDWILNGENTSFTVYKPGLYDIKFTDTAGNSTIVQKWIYVEDGLILYYDAENNTGIGHSDTATIWKDLSDSGNDGIISGATWSDNYLTFDGVDDFANTASNVELNRSKQITVELVDVDAELSKNGNSLIFEFSNDYNLNSLAFGASTSEYLSGSLSVTIRSEFRYRYNLKWTKENVIRNESSTSYSFAINTEDEYNNFIDISVNKETQELILPEQDKHKYDISNSTLNDYKLYFASREGTKAFSKMKLGCVRVYSRILTEEEKAINYEIDKYRFGIIDQI